MIGWQRPAEADVVNALVFFSDPVDVSMLTLEFIGVHVAQGFDRVIPRPVVPKSYFSNALVLVAEMDDGIDLAARDVHPVAISGVFRAGKVRDGQFSGLKNRVRVVHRLISHVVEKIPIWLVVVGLGKLLVGKRSFIRHQDQAFEQAAFMATGYAQQSDVRVGMPGPIGQTREVLLKVGVHPVQRPLHQISLLQPQYFGEVASTSPQQGKTVFRLDQQCVNPPLVNLLPQ